MSARLIINGTILNQPRLTGLGVYLTGLLPPLLDLCVADSRWSEIVITGRRDRLEPVVGRRGKDSKIRIAPLDTTHPIGRLVALDRLITAERKRPGRILFYSPTHHGVVRGGVGQVITIHDLFARLFPGNYRQQYLYFRWYLPRILAHSDRVIVDSTSTGLDLRFFYPDCPVSEVVYAALRDDLRDTPGEAPSVPDQSEKFFLFVGPSYRYKNCLRLIDALAVHRRTGAGRLIFAGGREEYVRELRRHLAEHHRHLIPAVSFLAYPSTAELAWLYRRAEALMITTRYEGFGLPALEAMSCDCPVVASKAGSLPEVCGEAALYVDPEDTDNIAAAMTRIASDQQLRRTLIEAGKQNVLRFDWQVSGRKVHGILLDCLTGRSVEK